MKCFYHNDLDGRCAGSVVAQYIRKTNKSECKLSNFHEVDYTTDLSPIISMIKEGEQVFFVDYSFTESTKWVLDELLERNCELIWCDHHTSSINLISQYPEYADIPGLRLDTASGAALIYMYLYNRKFEDLPQYILLVSDYDCWKFKYDPDTTHFKLGIECTQYDALDCIWDELSGEYGTRIASETIVDTLQDGATIKSYIDKEYESCYKQFAYEGEFINEIKCIVINRKANSWIFGDNITKYPLAICWAYNGESYQYSLYSTDPAINCAKLAEKFGGGGHKGAAGFTTTIPITFTKEKRLNAIN